MKMPVDTENPNRGVEAGQPIFGPKKQSSRLNRWDADKKATVLFPSLSEESLEISWNGLQMEWMTCLLNKGLYWRHEHMLVQLQTLTFSAMSHSHFASPGLSDGRTWYRVLWWLLHNMPCSGFQTPLETTGFVSSGAGPPLTPLAHLTTLYWWNRSWI